jgi:hypothetical protein
VVFDDTYEGGYEDGYDNDNDSLPCDGSELSGGLSSSDDDDSDSDSENPDEDEDFDEDVPFDEVCEGLLWL